ncbi:hypothetical protein Acr_00g0036980 [Actinidia rufa]|uniref:Uncharacterized protein n=1 Tax=Actinidia rufa TaxID=165716 RepID=A0A7J0DH61_9ERIC|nr:hypothetical protein Acr_00g0036980 [Actinidia rufa]
MEEIWLKSQSSNKGLLPAPNPSVFAMPHRPPSSSPSRPKLHHLFSPIMPSLIEQFLHTQPYAMSASSSIDLSSPSFSGMFSSFWVLDSGASHCMSPNSSSFTSLSFAPPIFVMTADGSPMPLAGVRSDSQTQKLIGTGHRREGLYVLDQLSVPAVVASGLPHTEVHLILKVMGDMRIIGEVRTMESMATKSLLRLPKESMVLEGNFLNHDLFDPFKVAEKALHISSSEYPLSIIKFLHEFRWSIGSVFPSYTPSWDDNLNLDDTLTFITLYMNRGFVCLIRVSTIIRAFTLVLMASIQASRKRGGGGVSRSSHPYSEWRGSPHPQVHLIFKFISSLE